jgi:hypothetical protein
LVYHSPAWVKVYDRFTTVVFALPVFPLPRELAGIGAAP